MFWAYDVSLGILLLEAIHVAVESPPELRPSWTDAVLEDLRTQVRLGANSAFLLDDDERDGQQRGYVCSIIAEAGRRLRDDGAITSSAAARRYMLDGEPYFLRGHDSIDGGVVAELSLAIEGLIRDDLPPVPFNGRHWLFGAEGGARPL